MKIAASIRRLRKERGITQEELATALGVTPQAISKWERDEGYPDITLMPKIAHFFDVSLDVVFGTRGGDEEKAIHDYYAHVMNASRTDAIAIAREGLAKYPHSYKLKSTLADALIGCLGQWTPPQEIWDEVIPLYEDILAHCNDQELLFQTKSDLCTAYGYVGETEKAKQVADSMPGMWESREVLMSYFLKGDDLIEHIQWTQGNILIAYYNLLMKMSRSGWYSTDEKLIAYQKMLDILAIHMEEREWNIGLCYTAQLYCEIALCHLEKGERGKAFEALRRAADTAIHADTVDPETQKRSLFRNHPSIIIYSENLERKSLRSDFRKARFDSIRDTAEFREILGSLAESPAEILKACGEKIARYGLEMKLTGAGYTSDYRKILITYTSEEALDLQKLADAMAREYCVEVELREEGE